LAACTAVTGLPTGPPRAESAHRIPTRGHGRTAPMSQDDLTLALALADRADALTSARFGALDLRVDTKPDLTPVTDADRAVEAELREVLGRERPDDSVVGEEFGGTTTFSGRQWIIDPIDGTKNFVRGVPVWASL